MTMIKETITDVKKLVNNVRGLQENIQKLRESMLAVEAFQHDVQKAVKLWQFKDQPRIEKIQRMVNKLSNKDKE